MNNITSDDWCTPEWLALLLGRFDLDPCSNARSNIQSYATCSVVGDSHNCISRDGISAVWERHHSVWINPPYSQVMPWAMRLAAHDGPWVALTKSDPTTKWFALLKHACTGDAPFRHRLKFERPDKKLMTANFPSHLFWHRWKPSRALASHLWLPTCARAA